jgi:hypothetical protein
MVGSVFASVVGVVEMIALALRYWWVLVIAALLGAVGVQQVRIDHAHTELARVQQEYTEAAQKAEAENRAIEAQRQKQAQEAIDASKKREAALRGDAAAARGALDRLRNAVRTASGVVPSGPGNAVSGPASSAELLLECGAEAQRLAEAADQHASDVQTLTEAWPK